MFGQEEAHGNASHFTLHLSEVCNQKQSNFPIITISVSRGFILISIMLSQRRAVRMEQ